MERFKLKLTYAVRWARVPHRSLRAICNYFGVCARPDTPLHATPINGTNMKMNFRLDSGPMLSTFAPSDAIATEIRSMVNTIHKRNDYSVLHYEACLKCIGDGAYLLELERGGIVFTDAGNRHQNRVHYEANILAFAQNLHALCDSFPFAVSRILSPLHYTGKKGKQALSKKQCGWNPVFFKAVGETHPRLTEFLSQLHRFASNKDFLLLRGLVNQCKHQYLPRILNQGTSLHFELIEYADATGTLCSQANLDAKVLMMRWHNRLLRRLYLLYIDLYRARLKQLSVSGGP
jgi:hypothetical protein